MSRKRGGGDRQTGRGPSNAMNSWHLRGQPNTVLRTNRKFLHHFGKLHIWIGLNVYLFTDMTSTRCVFWFPTTHSEPVLEKLIYHSSFTNSSYTLWIRHGYTCLYFDIRCGYMFRLQICYFPTPSQKTLRVMHFTISLYTFESLMDVLCMS